MEEIGGKSETEGRYIIATGRVDAAASKKLGNPARGAFTRQIFAIIIAHLCFVLKLWTYTVLVGIKTKAKI